MGKTSLKDKKIMALVLVVLYLGCVSLLAQQIPKTYVAQKTSEKIIVDGRMLEKSWENAKWTDFFIDIEGNKGATFKTRVKMIWDERYLYFLADIEEPHIWATLKQRDTIIFYNNDFELFIDPDGDTHNYYEFEMNALNTVWDLFLSKPYRNNGKVLGAWDIKGLKSAVSVNGTLNDPSDTDKSWAVEIAIPWSFHTDPGRATHIPENEFWRINFSRVNWDFDLTNERYSRKKDGTGNYLPEHNWVWSPQGVINMHEPERWGYVYFSTDSVGTDTNFEIPEDEHIKWYLYELFRDVSNENEGKTIWKKVNGQLQAPAKTILGRSVTAILEKHTFGTNIWAISPFTNKKLVIDNDGKFNTYHQD